MNETIRSLGYVGLNVSDADAWDELLTSVFALERRAEAADRRRHYRIDRWHHRLTLYDAGRDDIAYIGWEVADKTSLEELADKLRSADVAVEPLSAADAAERAVLGGAFFADPVMGMRHELFYGPTVDSRQFSPSRPMQGYATGDQGMGHVVLMTSRQEEAVSFFTNTLGFRVSDVMDFGGDQWGGSYRHVFLHCNSRHHSLAIMSPPAGGGEGQLNHLALTAVSFDDLGYAWDIVREKRIPVLMTLGKHVNDLATSFYVATPSGSALELAYGGIEVGERWEVRHYDDTKIWGHHVFLPPKPLA